jgi:two-component system response regulator YesN
MYRLLIVDDEPIIADGLFELFEEEKEPELDLFRAYSGEEALRCAQRAKIDIVLADICMPDMDGLELQKEIRKQWPGSKFVFLTGFNDFGYVQSAIRNDSVDYILKTEGDEPILKAVRNAAALLDRETSDRRSLQQAREKKRMYLSILGGRFLEEIVQGASYTRDELLAQFRELEIPLRADAPVLPLLGRVAAREPAAGFAERMKALQAAQDLGKAQLMMASAVAAVALENDDILWLMQPRDLPAGEGREESWRKLALFAQGCMDSVQAACRQILDARLSLAAAGGPVPWDGMGRKFDRLKAALLKAGGLDGEALIIDEAPGGEEPHKREEHDDRPEDAARGFIKRAPVLKSLLESGRKEEFRKLLGEMAEAAGRMDGVPESIMRELYLSVSMPVLSHINENRLADLMGAREMEALTRLDAHASRCGAFLDLMELAGRVFDRRCDESRRDAARILSFVREYVGGHIGGDLSLTAMSGMLHFNPSYFSRLFKSIGGTGYSEYVARERTGKARELLRSSGISINDISAMLGFNAPSNFSRFFKKNAGQSPQEYRDTLSPAPPPSSGRGMIQDT